MASASEIERRPGIDGWVYVAAALAVLLLLGALVIWARPGLLGVVLWYLLPWLVSWLALLTLAVGVVWSAIRRPFWRRSRAAGFAVLAALACSGLAFQTYPSSHDGRPSRVRFRLPMDGPITVGWGGAHPEVNYHVSAPEQRWAYDLLVARGGQTHRGAGDRATDYYAYGLEVRAPASGVVRVAFDGDTDRPIGVMDGYKDESGNHVVVEVAPGEYLFLCHLQPGSVAVRPGRRVAEGEVLGRVGNSGHTSEPHLHIHLQDTLDDIGEGIPLYFHHYRVGGRLVDRGIPTGGIRGEAFVGQVVENVAP